ncbi:hypothetical protein HDU98_002784 [Podochytrium sp. JEL0797]|nr:hypothetical protein HDU98_002784 [Podochytrium sp. JEL0797]
MPSNSTVKVVSELPESAFFTYANKEMLNKWRQDKTVPLVDVLESFEVFQSDTKGPTGIQHVASKSEMKNAFGSEDVNAVLAQILGKGKETAMPRDYHKSSQKGSSANFHNASR